MRHCTGGSVMAGWCVIYYRAKVYVGVWFAGTGRD